MSELEVGKPRFGWLIDGDASTPSVAASIEDTGQALHVRIPWSNDANTRHLHRWFSQGIDYSDDPNRVRHQYRPPDHLWFQDPDGVVALVGTRAGSSRFVLTAGIGEGVIPIDYAVLDTGGGDYSSINGLRSEIEGLADWVGLRSLEQTPSVDSDGALNELRITLRAPATVPLSRNLDLRFQPHFSTERLRTGDLAIHETVVVESRVKRAATWARHLAAHNAVRDLVGVSWWRLGAVPRLWALRDGDHYRALSGKSYGDRWAEVRTHRLSDGKPIAENQPPLFSFGDMGASGVRRWQRLRSEFSRGVNPILATLNPLNAGLEANLMLSCAGLDGIGYRLAMASGFSASKADRERHATRLRRVANEVPFVHGIDVEEWAQRAADANNGIKHASRDMPDVLTMAETLRQNGVIFRLWVAARLGVSDQTIRRTSSVDPGFQPLVLL